MGKELNVWIAGVRLDMPETWIYSALAVRGVRLTVFHSRGMREDLLDLLRKSGAECLELNYHGRLDFRATQVFRRELRRRPCDVIYCTLNKPLAAALRAVRGYPSVKVVAYRGTMGHLTHWDPSSWLTFFHPRLNHLVAVSDAVRGYLVDDKGIAADAVTRIYKGHDVAWYGDGVAERAKDGPLKVGFVGQIRHVKGIEYLLDAMKLIPREKDVTLTLVGGISEHYLKRRIAKETAADPRICHLGFRKDATALVGGFDVMVMPTVEREGLAKAVIEAMAQGVPAVVSAVGGLPEIVSDGETGFVVPPRNAAALADALVKLADDRALLRKFGVAARAQIAKKFDYRESAAQFEALFRKLAGH